MMPQAIRNFEQFTTLSETDHGLQKEMPERRATSRVDVDLAGRVLTQTDEEHPCRVINISPSGIAIASPAEPEVGEKIVAYLDEIGRLEGIVVRHFRSGFAIKTNHSKRRQVALAEQLTWIVNKDSLGLSESREHSRQQVSQKPTVITLADGEKHHATVTDISMGGIAVASFYNPVIDERLFIGSVHAKVVRLTEEGFAASFMIAPSKQMLEQFQ